MEINGIAHVMLTVGNYDACLPFYERLLPALGLQPVFNTDGYLYCVGGRTAGIGANNLCGAGAAELAMPKERRTEHGVHLLRQPRCRGVDRRS